jgi:hypothetical protein
MVPTRRCSVGPGLASYRYAAWRHSELTDEEYAPGMLTQGGPAVYPRVHTYGRVYTPGPLGLAIAYDSYPVHIALAWDLMEVTYICHPWLSESYHPRYAPILKELHERWAPVALATGESIIKCRYSSERAQSQL